MENNNKAKLDSSKLLGSKSEPKVGSKEGYLVKDPDNIVFVDQSGD